MFSERRVRKTTSRKVAGSIPDGFIENFSLTSFFWPHCDPRFDSASNRKEYHGYLLTGKGD